ncbi:hypothetical protein ACOMHN_017558 [Nucella lapillus]
MPLWLCSPILEWWVLLQVNSTHAAVAMQSYPGVVNSTPAAVAMQSYPGVVGPVAGEFHACRCGYAVLSWSGGSCCR